MAPHSAKPDAIPNVDPIAELIYLLGHDLRGSIRAITEIPIWLEEELADNKEEMSETTADCLRLLKQHGRRLDKLVQAFSVYASIGQEAKHPQNCPIEILSDRVKEVGFPPNWEIHLETDLSELPISRDDATTLFNGLLTNARDHAQHDAARLDVRVCQAGPNAKISVSDNGPGIVGEDCSKALEPLVKLHGNRSAEGVGMGLAIVRKIVDTYGGRLTLGSGYGGVGLLVEVELPV